MVMGKKKQHEHRLDENPLTRRLASAVSLTSPAQSNIRKNSLLIAGWLPPVWKIVSTSPSSPKRNELTANNLTGHLTIPQLSRGFFSPATSRDAVPSLFFFPFAFALFVSSFYCFLCFLFLF